MQQAPFLSEICETAPDGRAYWLDTADGPRIRAVLWPAENARGTVLMFPGRTEYAEKYAQTAADFAKEGYATFAIDWRGQGLAERLLDNPKIGHVGVFSDYQRDVAAVIAAAEHLELPKPWYLIAHSMGGAIGLRALMEGLPVNASVFTGPMWGIILNAAARPAAWAITWASRKLGTSNGLAPGTRQDAYVLTEPFADNTLTTDPDMFEMMRQHLLTHPELSLGGPSLNWLHEALKETLELSRQPSPAVPCITFVGTNERIVDPRRIQSRMARWPDGQLVEIDGAEHEVLMETPAIRASVIRQCVDLFEAHRDRDDQTAPVAC